MKSRKQDFVLGAAAIGLLGLFMATVLFIYPSMGYPTRRIVVQFDHEQGVAPIKVGSPVMLSGVLQKGKITALRTERIDVASPLGTRSRLMIVVEAEVDRDLELFEDCKLTTDQPPVGGSGVLVILSVGTPGAAPLGEGPISGLAPQSLSAAIGTLSRRLLGPEGIVDQLDRMVNPDVEGSLHNKLLASLTDINEMTRELSAQFKPADRKSVLGKIHRIMDDLNGTTAALRAQVSSGDEANLLAKIHAALDRLGEGLNEATELLRDNRPAVTAAIGSLERVARTLDERMIGALQAELDRDDPSSLLGKIHVSMDTLNASLANVQTISETGRQLLLTNRPALDKTIGNVKQMSEELRLASEEIRLAPWRLLYQPTEREKQEMSIFEAARTFAEAATYLDDAAARLEAVVAAGPAETRSVAAGAEIEAIQQSLRSAFERFERAEKFLWEKMK